MCGDEIGDIVDFVSPFVPPVVPTPIGPVWLPPGLPFGGPFALPRTPDLSNVDNEDNEDIRVAPTRLEELKNSSYAKDPATIILDDFTDVTFTQVHGKFETADDNVAPYNHKDWGDARSAIIEGIQNFQIQIGVLERLEDGWKGKTHDAAIANIESSYPEPTAAGNGAGVMGILVDAFANTIYATKQNIMPNKERYDAALRDFPEYADEIHEAYDNFARDVMREVYSPNIVQIAADNPAFTVGGPPGLNQQQPPPPGPDPNSLPGGGSFGGPGGGTGSLGGPGKFDPPKVPEFPVPKVPDPNKPTIPSIPPPTTPPGLGGLTDPVRAASDAAKNALGSAADAAKQAAQAGKMPNGAGQGPPEGVLGLGPKGLGGSPSGASGGKSGAGGGPARGLAGGRATGAPVTPVAARLPGAAAAGAGVGAMGPPGAGAPAAGQRGGDNAKGHQVIKALRRKKTGQHVAGEADAVVPVIGAAETPPAAENAQGDQPQQPEQQGSSVRSAQPGTHRVDHPTQVPGR